MSVPRIKVQKTDGSYAWYRLALFTIEERDPDGKPMLLRIHTNPDTVFKLSTNPADNEFITAFVPESNFPSR